MHFTVILLNCQWSVAVVTVSRVGASLWLFEVSAGPAVIAVELLVFFVAAAVRLWTIHLLNGSGIPNGHDLVGRDGLLGAMAEHTAEAGDAAAILRDLYFFLDLQHIYDGRVLK